MDDTFEIFICCGGKCGGTTLANTFYENGYKTTHLHSTKHLGNFKSNIDIDNVFGCIDKSRKENTIYIIDVYRTPVERKISCFFQKIKLILPNYQTMSVHELIKFFNEKILFSSVAEKHPINDFLIKYDAPLFKKFNFKRRYNIIKKKNIVFIKLLFSDIKDWDKILSEIFEKNITIYPTNLTEEKEINELYKLFKQEYHIPSSYLNIIKNNKEFNIHHRPYEQKKYINMWEKKSISK